MTKNLKKSLSTLMAIIMVLSIFSIGVTAFANDEITAIELGVSQIVTIDVPDGVKIFSFTPATTDVYAFVATADDEDLDTMAVLLDSQDEIVAVDDDSGVGFNYYLAYPMTAGETYYLHTGLCDETYTGTFEVDVVLSEVIDVNYGAVSITQYDSERYYEDYEFNEETGEYDDIPFNRYFYEDLISYEITMRDGSKITGTGVYYTFNDELNYIIYADTQGVNSEWQGGNTYDIAYSAFGFAKFAPVTIIDPSKAGWSLENGKWAYYVNGVKVVNDWMLDSTGWCYLGADGYMVTNSWIMDSVGWCYVGSDGYCLTNCWMADSMGWCYLDANGRMATNQWIMDSQGWCFVGADGYCITNSWVKDSIGWCYLDANGRMVYNAWVQDSIGWCYVGADGYMVYDQWAKDSNGWCYIGSDGYYKG